MGSGLRKKFLMTRLNNGNRADVLVAEDITQAHICIIFQSHSIAVIAEQRWTEKENDS